MSILIKGMEMPKDCTRCFFRDGPWCSAKMRMPVGYESIHDIRNEDCPLVDVPTPHGKLVDADELRRKMYREAFETDTDMQKWDSGCWIRYKMLEQVLESTPTIIEAEGE